MDPETEKHFAALIMEEAARLRLQAEKEGVHAYLAQPRARGKPNPQFLKATVRSIEQANRAAEVSEMWKRRAMELELEETEKKRGRRKHRNTGNTGSLGSTSHSYHDKPRKAGEKLRSGHGSFHQMSSSPRLHTRNATDCTSEESDGVVYDQSDDKHSHGVVDDLREKGLKEDEVEQFLHSRVKRGRGAVGSRMDETGPYPVPHPGHQRVPDVRVKEDWEDRVIGPLREVDKGGKLPESKKHGKRRRKVDEDEDCSEEEISSDLKKKEKRRSKKKHRSLHKKSKKKRQGSM